MRTDGLAFQSSNRSESREPVFVIEISFDSGNTDTHYISTGTVSGFSGALVNTAIESISGTSQKINPDKANATIGTLTFTCLDEGLTDLMRTKLDEGKGLYGKRVRVYQGFAGLLWSEYQLIQTQVIDSNIKYKDGVYKFKCADIQRALRKKIFIAKETTLTSSITAEQTTVPAFNTSKFESVYQVPSNGGKTLLRALQQSGDYPDLAGVDHCGLFKIENDVGFEIALWYEKNDLTNTFTKVIRGVLDTTALAVTVDPGATNQNAPKITEYVYLEMPAVKLAYAAMTGSLYGHAGEYLPDHWHLGISTDYIKTSAYTDIGADLWDLSDDDKGYPATVRGYSDIDGKIFLEQDIFYALGLYAPILTTGELSLKRFNYVGPNGGFVRELNDTNVVSYSDLTQDLSAVVNTFVLKWNWNERKEKYTRTSVYVDPNSGDKHQERDPKVIKLKTLHGSRHSDASIKFHFDTIRSRYAGPPLLLKLEVTPDQNDLEVGDIVRVKLPHIQDALSENSGPIDRNFEVQSVKVDWVTGRVNVDLFGSSQRASDIPPEETETVASEFVASEGTEITAANFPAAGITSAGGTTTVAGAITFAGSANMNNSSAVYYCNEDLTFTAAAVVTITANVQLRVNGFLQVNGLFDGKGRGHAGGDGVSGNYSLYPAANRGVVGLGATLSQRGGEVSVLRAHSGDGYFSSYDEVDGQLIAGNPFPRPALSIDASGNLSGMPSDLRGTSGSGGMSSYETHRTRSRDEDRGGYDYTTAYTERVAGGDGGAGGAGLAIFSKGMAFGIGGDVDLSGADGLLGDLTTYMKIAGGSGAGGAPGGVIYAALDSAQTFPDMNSGFTLNQGISPQQGKLYRSRTFHNVATASSVATLSSTTSSRYVGAESQVENLAAQHGHIVFIDTRSTAVEDEKPYVESQPDFSLTEYLNTPVTPDGNRTTIEVSITPPSDDNYSYSVVDYRKQGDTAWINNGPAAPEGLIQVPSDGSIYEVMVRAVSKAKNASLSGIIKTIALTNVSGRTNAELAVIYPLVALTGFQVVGGGLIFTGLDCGVTWSNDNAELAYFNHYKIEVYDGATLLRTEQSVSPFYVYTYEKNRADYLAKNAAAGVYLALEIHVKTVSKYRNDANALYATGYIALTFTASNTSDPQNLRFYVHPTNTSQLTDDAGLGDTANWPDVVGAGKPADNATAGAQWEGNITDQPDRQNLLNNLVDISGWESGGALPSGLSHTSGYGYVNANSLVVAEGPTGFDEVCWQVAPVNAASDAGGFSFSNRVLGKSTKVYRVSVWFRCSALTGSFRFRSGASYQLSDGAIDYNPYVFEAAAPEINKWFLAVMVVHPYNTSRVSASGLSGVYDPDTGEIISYFDEFKTADSGENPISLGAAFQWIDSNNGSDVALFARPRLEVIDGSESRISTLIGVPEKTYVEQETAPVMFGVASAGTKITSNGANVTTSRTATGDYRLNHSSGYSGYPVVITPRSGNVDRIDVSESAGYIRVRFYDTTNAEIDSAFSVMLDYRYNT